MSSYAHEILLSLLLLELLPLLPILLLILYPILILLPMVPNCITFIIIHCHCHYARKVLVLLTALNVALRSRKPNEIRREGIVIGKAAGRFLTINALNNITSHTSRAKLRNLYQYLFVFQTACHMKIAFKCLFDVKKREDKRK